MEWELDYVDGEKEGKWSRYYENGKVSCFVHLLAAGGAGFALKMKNLFTFLARDLKVAAPCSQQFLPVQKCFLLSFLHHHGKLYTALASARIPSTWCSNGLSSQSRKPGTQPEGY